jgi:hypothetical protein
MRVLDQCVRLPFREAHEALSIQGLPLSLSHCERLTQTYGEVLERASVARLEALATLPLLSATTKPRVMVVQADGVYVMERDKPVPGQCEGREIKQVLFYPNSSPSEPDRDASSATIDDFIPLAQGLMRQAGLRQADASGWATLLVGSTSSLTAWVLGSASWTSSTPHAIWRR